MRFLDVCFVYEGRGGGPSYNNSGRKVEVEDLGLGDFRKAIRLREVFPKLDLITDERVSILRRTDASEDYVHCQILVSHLRNRGVNLLHNESVLYHQNGEMEFTVDSDSLSSRQIQIATVEFHRITISVDTEPLITSAAGYLQLREMFLKDR